MREHGTAAAALTALPEITAKAGVSDYQICPEGVIHAEIKAARKINARLIMIDDADYPTQLHDIDDAPPMFWTIGQEHMLRRPMVALVGARNASSLGTRMTKRLAAELGEAGYVIVSGLARGVDTAAHLGSIETGTIAVQQVALITSTPPKMLNWQNKSQKKVYALPRCPLG